MTSRLKTGKLIVDICYLALVAYLALLACLPAFLQDLFGRSPLLEAARANQDACCRVIMAAGGTLGLLSAVDKKAIADEAKAAQRAAEEDVKSQLGSMKPVAPLNKGWGRRVFKVSLCMCMCVCEWLSE